ncbi:MAG: bifunctional DNA-formamidopyrimidine glycosylase/DNA-(apurinic or apyrimidinic site) lyase [Elusimicrobiota bacterium]
MPELPEAETVTRQLRPAITGKIISSVWFSKKSANLLLTPRVTLSKELPKRKIVKVGRSGKKILLYLDSKQILVFGLGMTGNLFLRHSRESGNPEGLDARLRGHDGRDDTHIHFILSFNDKTQSLCFEDVRRFGEIRLLPICGEGELRRIFNQGPEPFRLNVQEFLAIIKTSRRPLKSLLLDQTKIAGLGNIYADEALFCAGLHPLKKTNRVDIQEAARLLKAINQTLVSAIKHHGSSIADYRTPWGKKGGFQNFHKAYGRAGKPCRDCGQTIKRIVLSGRSTCYCPKCQVR